MSRFRRIGSAIYGVLQQQQTEAKAATISRGIFLDFFAAQRLTKMASVRQAEKIMLYLAVIPDAGLDSRPAWRTINIARVRRTK